MPYHFDSKAFGELLDDAHNLSALSSTLEERLARLAVTDSGLPADDVLSSLVGGVSEAYAASREQAQIADNMLRRLVGTTASDNRRRPIVLVVDDSPDSREATALLLEEAGFRAVTAANGVEALIVAHYARPVVVLLDLMMPILDGLQTARLLSESHSTRNVKVVAYSGRADMFSRRLPGTFTAILPKPTTPEELLALVRQQAAISGAN